MPDFKIRICGDAHGHFDRYKKIIRKCDRSLQVGDMGVGFFTLWEGEKKALPNPPYDTMKKEGDHRFIRGNHDNPEVCKRQELWVPDGTYLYDKIFCVGGATSIDRVYRTEGWDWWPDEECSMAQLQSIVDSYARIKPDVVVTHECPSSIQSEYLIWANKPKIEDGSRTRQAFEVMLHHHQPRLWIFGHYHHTFTMRRGRTTFQCLDELDWADVEWTRDEDEKNDWKIEIRLGYPHEDTSYQV